MRSSRTGATSSKKCFSHPADDRVGWAESSEPTFSAERWAPKTPPTLQNYKTVEQAPRRSLMNMQPQQPLAATGLRHFLDLCEWDGAHIRTLLKEASRLKKAQVLGKGKPLLHGRVLGLIFEKP